METKEKINKISLLNYYKKCVLSKCYNEKHLIKKCKLLNKYCQICKHNDHNTNQCPSKIVFRRCPWRKLFECM
jgi:hypothetical protein